MRPIFHDESHVFTIAKFVYVLYCLLCQMISFTTFITTPCVVIHNSVEIPCDTYMYAYNVYIVQYIYTDLTEKHRLRGCIYLY